MFRNLLHNLINRRSRNRVAASRRRVYRRTLIEQLGSRELLAADLGFAPEAEEPAALVAQAVPEALMAEGEGSPVVINVSNAQTFRNTDVNGDGHVSPIDALLVIDVLNAAGNSGVVWDLEQMFANPTIAPDVNWDQRITAIDALLVINDLNNGDGEVTPNLSAKLNAFVEGSGNEVAVSNEIGVFGFDFNLLAEHGDVFVQEIVINGSWGDVTEAYLSEDFDGDGIYRVVDSADDGVFTEFGGLTLNQGDLNALQFTFDVAPNVVDGAELNFDLGVITAVDADDATPVNTFVVGGNERTIELATRGSVVVTDMSESTTPNFVLATGTNGAAYRFGIQSFDEDAEVLYLGVNGVGDLNGVSWLNVSIDGTFIGQAALDTALGNDAFGLSFFAGNFAPVEGVEHIVELQPIVSADDFGNFSGDRFQIGDVSIDVIGSTSLNPIDVAVPFGYGETQTITNSRIFEVTNQNPDPDKSAVFTGIGPAGRFGFLGEENLNFFQGQNFTTIDVAAFIVQGANTTVEVGSLYNVDDATQLVQPAEVRDGSGNLVVGSYTFPAEGGELHFVYQNLDDHPIDTDVEANELDVLATNLNVLNPKVNAALPSWLQVFADYENFRAIDQDAGSSNGLGLPLNPNAVDQLFTASTLYES